MGTRAHPAAAGLALLFCLLPGPAGASAESRPPEDMDEVQLLASRIRPAELRAEIIRTEDQFYEALNQRLDDPEMHVNCVVDARLGTRIKRRTCQPQYVATANANFFRELIQGLPAVPPGVAIASSEVVFQRKVVELLNQDASVRELAQRREALTSCSGQR